MGNQRRWRLFPHAQQDVRCRAPIQSIPLDIKPNGDMRNEESLTHRQPSFPTARKPSSRPSSQTHEPHHNFPASCLLECQKPVARRRDGFARQRLSFHAPATVMRRVVTRLKPHQHPPSYPPWAADEAGQYDGVLTPCQNNPCLQWCAGCEKLNSC